MQSFQQGVKLIMYGFLICRGCSSTVMNGASVLSFRDTHFYFTPPPRFENDRLFFEDDEKLLLLDGVIFNKRELMQAHEGVSWQQLVSDMYRAAPESFQNELRGSFRGAVCEKASGRLLLFTNHSGEKAVYYTAQGSVFLAASHNDILTGAMKQLGLPVIPDEAALRELLATGSFLHGNTPFRGVRRLVAGKRLELDGDSCTESRYHMFHNVPEHELTLEQCVEEMDKRFRKAVDRIFSKNEEYGYQGECDLSGGLDSRMATWVAHDLGYKNILNICYCQSGKIDNTTSRSIAHDIGNDYLFLAMDGGDFLMDIDETVGKFGGQVCYNVCTGANRALKKIADRNIKLCVTGLLGELDNAYWVEGESHTAPGYTQNRYSSVIPFSAPAEYSEGYDNFEQMNLYEYSVPLFMSSALVRQQQCDVTSPFVDVDFLEFSYRVPLKWRRHYLLTMTWMVTKYPQAARYVWQSKRMPVDKFYRHQVYIPKYFADCKRFVIRCVNKAGRMLKLPIQYALNDDMNPLDTWLRANPRLHQFTEDYFSQNIDRVGDPQLKADLQSTFREGGASDKIQALNLLAVYKRYF